MQIAGMMMVDKLVDRKIIRFIDAIVPLLSPEGFIRNS